MAEMQYGKIDGVDKDISRLCQGTMMLKQDEMEVGFKLLDAVFELGCNTFDSSTIYGGGQCERVLGKWIADRGIRDKVVILDKCAHHNPDRKRVTPYDIESDLHDSLARLGVDYIDIYAMHRDDPSVPVGPIVEIFNKFLKAGVIGAYGGSNWTHTRVAEANKYAEEHGLVAFACSSPNFSLAEMIESPWGDDCVSISGPQNEEARQWYAERNMPLFTWSSLARGFFAGNISRESLDNMKPVDRSSIKTYCYEVNFKRLDRVEELAKEKGVSVPQVAMSYVANYPGLNIFALIGTYNKEEFAQAIEASALKLTPEEMDWLDLRSDDR